MSSAGTAYVDIEARTDDVPSAIEAALASVDGTVETVVEADTSSAQSEIDGLESSPVDVPVDAEVDAAQSEIDSLDSTPVDVPVTADTSDAQSSIDDLSGSIEVLTDAAGASGGALGGMASELGGMVGLSGGAAAGLVAVAGGFTMAASAAADAEAVTATTNSILNSLGPSAITTAGHIQELSQRVMEYSGFSDESVASGANMLLMFQGIQDIDVFDQAIEGAADLARYMGTDVPSAARMLGRTLSDPEAGMGRLKRVTGDLTDAQKAQIASFMAVGDTASAQGVILDFLHGRIGNLAEDYGNTLSGKMDRARQSMDEFAENAGSSLIPVLGDLAEAVTPVLDAVQSLDSTLNGALLSGPIQAIMGIGDGMRGVGTVTGELAGELDNTAGAAGDAAGAFEDLGAAMDDYLGRVVDVPGAQRDVQQSISDMVETMSDGESSWYDMADAQDEVVSSTADLIQKMSDQGASHAELTGVIENTIGMLRSERDAGHLTAQQFQIMADKIRGIPTGSSTEFTAPGLQDNIRYANAYHQKLRDVDSTNPSSQVTAPGMQDNIRYGTVYHQRLRDIDGTNPSSSVSAPGLGSALGSALALNASYDRMDDRTVTTTVLTKYVNWGSPLPKNATGTESAMPGLALVGEQGPELVAFGGGERVWTADQTRTILSPPPAKEPTPSIVVNVHGTATAADGQAVVDALRRWQQRNGPVPVRVSS